MGNVDLSKDSWQLNDEILLKELLLILKTKRDPGKISKLAIHQFGSLQGVLKQPYHNLKTISGLTPSTIRGLKIIFSLCREMIKPTAYPIQKTRQLKDFSYFLLTTPQLKTQCIRLIFLNEENQILRDFIYKQGVGNYMRLYLREMIKEIFKAEVTRIVFIHHKIGKTSLPTSYDQKKFKIIQQSLENLDINLLDYLIITEHSLFSFKDKTTYSAHLFSIDDHGSAQAQQ